MAKKKRKKIKGLYREYDTHEEWVKDFLSSAIVKAERKRRK